MRFSYIIAMILRHVIIKVKGACLNLSKIKFILSLIDTLNIEHNSSNIGFFGCKRGLCFLLHKAAETKISNQNHYYE